MYNEFFFFVLKPGIRANSCFGFSFFFFKLRGENSRFKCVCVAVQKKKMSIKREDKTMETPSLNDAYTLSEGVATFFFERHHRRENINASQRGRLVGKRRKKNKKQKNNSRYKETPKSL